MSSITVRVIVGPKEIELETEPLLVPAMPVVLAISGANSRTVRLDTRATRLSSGPVGLIAIDLTLSTGYHHLEVDGQSFWFGTEDAKLGLDGLEAMLTELRALGTGWTGQALFSDGTGLRDVHVLYAWLDRWADYALGAVAAVVANPRSQTRASRRVSGSGGLPVLLGPSIRLWRSAPNRYLAPSSAGALEVSEKRYEPLRVVVRDRSRSLDTIANRRAVAVLEWVRRLSLEVLGATPAQPVQVRCRLWANEAERIGQRPVARALRAGSGLALSGRQPEEVTESRYRKTYGVARDLHGRFGWSASVRQASRYSYVDRADAIYQAYAASKLASELGLTQTDPVLGRVDIAFSGPDFDLYYDAVPPGDVLRSWRAASSRPDQSRPDFVLVHRQTGRLAVLDAKYRVGADGQATESSRKDVSAYMGLYGLESIAIVYPGTGDDVGVIEGQGKRIIEIPLAPPGRNLGASIPELLARMQLPPF